MKQLLKILSLLLVLVISASLTIGLTFAPCFASLCTEQFFGFETRVHIATYYALLAPTGCFLLLRAYSPLCLRISNHHLTRREVPVLQKRISVGGLGLALWPVGITLVTTAFWAAPELQYWGLRWVNAKVSLAVTGLIGHHANYLLSLVIIPVSRNSVLGRTFELHQSTLLYAHKLVAYLMVVAVMAHGVAYFVGLADENSNRRFCYLTEINPGICRKLDRCERPPR